jgi:hypothetical protein
MRVVPNHQGETMSPARKWILLCLAAVLAVTVSCGLPKLVWPTNQTATAFASIPTDTPIPTEPAIFDLLGSTWLYRDDMAEESVEFDITFNEAGSLYNTHPNDNTPDNDTWTQDGTSVTMSFNDGYAICQGTISSDGTHIEGTATNEVGKTWNWTAERISP